MQRRFLAMLIGGTVVCIGVIVAGLYELRAMHSPIEHAAASDWKLSVKKDPMTDKTEAYVAAYDDAKDAMLTIKCVQFEDDGTPEYYISITTSEFLGDSGMGGRDTLMRIDDDPTISDFGWGYDDHSAHIYYGSKPKLAAIVNRLSSGSRLRVRLATFRYRAVDLDFHLNANKKAFEALLKNCK